MKPRPMLPTLAGLVARLVHVAIASVVIAPASGEVIRFEISKRERLADGKPFGDAGRYERIEGRVFYAIDPKLPQNQAIVDLEKAPRNPQGKVEFSADLSILAPTDPTKGNGAMLYDVNNRGNKV